jgi:Tol biopolymer transport system component
MPVTWIARLTNDSASDLLPAWSPDNSLIAFTSTASKNLEIWVTRSHPGGVEVRETSNPRALDFTPTWSPDGTKIAFFTSTLAWSLEVYEITYNPSGLGTGQTQITSGATNELHNWCCTATP